MSLNSIFTNLFSKKTSENHRSIYGSYLDKMEKDRTQFSNAIFKRDDSISRFLPYEEYLPEHKMYLLKDGSIGAVFELVLIEHETMPAEELIEVVKSLESLMKLPSNCVLQIQSYQREVDEKHPIWDKLKRRFENPNPISKSIFDRKIEALNSEEIDTNLLERKTVLSIRYFPADKRKEKAVRNALKSANSHLLKEIDEFVTGLKEFKGIIESYKLNSKVGLREIEIEEFLSITRPILNPVSYKNYDFPAFKTNESLSKQISFSSGYKSYEGIETEGMISRTVSLKGIPAKCWPAMMAEFTLPEFPYTLSLNITFPKKEVLSKKLNTKLFFQKNAATANSKRQKEESIKGLERLEYGDQGVTCTIFGMVFGKNQDEIDKRVRQLVSLFQKQFETYAIEEPTVGFGQTLCCLPLTFDHLIEEKMQRFSTLYRADVANFIPIFDSFKGTSDPIQVFTSRENTIVPFSPFSNATSNHSVVVADTGSGKSALIIDMIASAKMMDPEPLVFIVDKKTSYTMLCKTLGGDITVFDPNSDMPFSPFRGHYDEAKVSFLSQLLLTAISLTSTTFNLEPEHITAVSKCLRLAYNNKYAQRGLKFEDGKLSEEKSDELVYVDVDDVVRELSILKAQPEYETSRDQIEELIKKLKPFYGDGPYAKYLNVTEATKKSESLFYVYDLENLTDPVLSELITMSMFEEIRMTINRRSDEGRMSIIIAEELGQNGDKNPIAKEYWSDFAETMRKKGAWLVGLAPNPKIFFNTAVGQAFWAAADNFFFMKLSADNSKFILENSDLIDENTQRILKSLDTVKDSHADIFYTNKNKTVSGVFRFPQTSIDKWLAPTNQKDAKKANAALEKFKNAPQKALDYLVEKFPKVKKERTS